MHIFQSNGNICGCVPHTCKMQNANAINSASSRISNFEIQFAKLRNGNREGNRHLLPRNCRDTNLRQIHWTAKYAMGTFIMYYYDVLMLLFGCIECHPTHINDLKFNRRSKYKWNLSEMSEKNTMFGAGTSIIFAHFSLRREHSLRFYICDERTAIERHTHTQSTCDAHCTILKYRAQTVLMCSTLTLTTSTTTRDGE